MSKRQPSPFVSEHRRASSWSTSSPSKSRSSTSLLNAIGDVDTARTTFYIWFFGASGAAGIALSTLPRIYNSFKTVSSLKDAGPSLGGETVGISPLVGYPRDLFVKDVEQVLQTSKNVEQIVTKFPQEANMWSMKYGYLTFKAFEQANAKNNPLAVRAVMDAMAKSPDVVQPEIAQERIETYLSDFEEFKSDLLTNKLISYSSFGVVLFLLGLAAVIIGSQAYQGFFPEWPGADGFPFTIFDAEKGLSTIPNYWI